MNLIILIPLHKFNFRKNAFFILLIFILFSCKTNRINTARTTLNRSYTIDLQNCIDNAMCTIELIPNSNLIIKKDAYNNNYIEIKKGRNTIIKYQFKKSKIPNSVDTNYSEILYIEIDNYNKTIILKDIELQEVKMTYGRLCYCKGSSGYFNIKKGDLELILKKNKLTLNTNFSVENVPQMVTQIHEKITLQK